MEFLMDPSIWAGLLTLVVLEIVLGIDNLVFIAILADKLPPKQRDKARNTRSVAGAVHASGPVVGHFLDGYADYAAV
ncbi:Integral membrane protein TerC family [Serratia plymuthica]|uniref:Integral membrane protein TerC family n=1 Tax=Serratia plymuthica TaxID=82996 RepID=A0A2X4V9T7_SERPL|nr:Integral membrane protein TerC family [Serratia plymuthica]